MHSARLEINAAVDGRVESDNEGVDAFASQLRDVSYFIGRIDLIGVVAFASDERVNACTANQSVVAIIASERVGFCIADEEVVEIVAGRLKDTTLVSVAFSTLSVSM